MDSYLGARVAIAANGGRCAVATKVDSPEIKVCDLAMGNVQETLKPEHDVRCLAFSYDGRLLVAGLYDGTAITWDVSQAAPGR